MSTPKGPSPLETAIADAMAAAMLRWEESQVQLAQSLGGTLLRGARAFPLTGIGGGGQRVSFADGSLVGFALRETSKPIVRAIAVPNPPVGAEWSYTVPPGSSFTLEGILYSLTTSAVVGNRIPVLQIKDATGVLRFVNYLPTQAASVSTQYQWAAFGGSEPNASAMNLPAGLTLGPGWTIGSNTPGIDAAGDAYTTISVLGTTGPDAASVELRAHDASGDLLVPINLGPGATALQWFAGGGISYADGLYVAVTGSVDGSVFLRGRDRDE